MAPLVPDILSNELGILSALLIGIAFGYVLEQAGFSSSRRSPASSTATTSPSSGSSSRRRSRRWRG